MFQWTTFGKIKYNNVVYSCDIIVHTDGTAEKRDYSIPDSIYGTSHKIGPEELSRIIDDDTKIFILGTGQYGIAHLTDEGRKMLKEMKIKVEEIKTPDAIKRYNELMSKKRKPKVTALMHVTC
ncbi:MAG: hypothetical protein J7K68_04970 [Candidatus Diapherotrites archaeon]|nr:hypothetical protein [Candidatus Diapherotrites archaeon]